LAVKFADSSPVSMNCLTEDEKSFFMQVFKKVQEISHWKNRSYYTKGKGEKKNLKRI
jgi:hypothetical protein